MISDEEKARMVAYRQEHFAAKCEVPSYNWTDDEFLLSVTHNGFQWTTIGLTSSEAKRLIYVLTMYLDEHHPNAKS